VQDDERVPFAGNPRAARGERAQVSNALPDGEQVVLDRGAGVAVRIERRVVIQRVDVGDIPPDLILPEW